MIELLLSIMMAAATPAVTTEAKAEGQAIPTRLPGVIMTQGTGEITVLPDRVVMSVSLYNVDKDLATAFANNDKVANSARDLLYGLGVPKTNIMVTNITVQPEYSDKEQTKIKRYRIWRSLSVIIDDLQLASKCLDALLNAGAVDVTLDQILVRDQEKKQFEAWKASLTEASKHLNDYSRELDAPLSRLEWASDSPEAYSIYRTRRSVILGKLREEAGAARDLSQLMTAESSGYYPAAPAPPPASTPTGWANESGEGGGYGSGGGIGTYTANAKGAYYKDGDMARSESAASLNVSEQKYFGQFYVNMIVSPAMRPGLGEEGMIFIEGRGVARMRLDRANLTCRVYSTEKELATAYTANDTIVTNAQKELGVSLGLKANDISTTNLSVYPEYQNEATGKIRRYRVVRDLKIKLDPLNVGEACAALVRSGVNDIDGLSYELADRKALEEKARLAALDDARKRAELVADSFGQRLGSLEWSSENPGNYPVYLFGKSNPEILTPTVQIEQNEMVAYVNVLAHYFAYPVK